MPDGQLLEFSGLTKRFGGITAVSSLTARVEPGLVTGFLGPNGAGKTTSLRILLGLVRASAGSATIGGREYRSLRHPLQSVGAVLEASSFHPGRSGANHLAVYARAAGLPKTRVNEVLDLVGLSDAAGRNVGGYSLGMRQRLGLATALLGDPGVLVLDEPTNGLDPEGIRWIRGFLQQLAREGRTVLVSSHLLAEVQQTVDALLIISHGRLVFQGGIEELSDDSEHATVVDSPDRAALSAALGAAGAEYQLLRSGLTVSQLTPTEVGAIAASAGVALSSLHRRGPALEEVFLDLVNGTRTHPSADGAVPDAAVMAAAELAPLTEEALAASTADESAPSDEKGLAAAARSDDEAAAPPEAATTDEAAPDDGAAPEDAAPEEAPAPLEEDAVEELAPEETAPAHTASFAVASTGVIDIVASEQNATDVEFDGTPNELDDDDDLLNEYVRTEADDEADRFFASFDAGTEGAAEETPPDESDGDRQDADAEGADR
ncbi:ABC transporter ATP-binding protein [Microbacterium sp. C7(2022)]|uniref:ABC transporter ATP-binding protein n=1 Tax=Microbacterium sp. C7(2022) TaxID=2992759 RepID=UPI00237B304C|nr:ATP-binding cassette domain-containing protein [Microbacterium sp. C7(2022)]MDE0546554.1 ATP-binding cassette domain-containing protein [Microbacterium sp. C7(2022)]